MHNDVGGPTAAQPNEVLHSIRQVAASVAFCPLALVELRSRPCEVGALVRGERRVESVLYLRDSVLTEDGCLKLPGNVSPVSGEAVDGFMPMPAIQPMQGQEFFRFLDWSGDHHTSAAEVAAAVAAILPVEEESVERFIRERFDVDREGVMAGNELLDGVLPYMIAELDEFINATRVSDVPSLSADSPLSDFHGWFDHWDFHHVGELDHSLARFAIAVLLFKVLTKAVELPTKEVIVTTFVEKVGLAGGGRLTLERFTDCIVPALRQNLPHQADIVFQAPGGTLTLKLQSPWLGVSFPIQVPSTATVADLRDRVAATWPLLGPVHMYVAGTFCDNPQMAMCEVPGMHDFAAVGVMPDEASSSNCTFA